MALLIRNADIVTSDSRYRGDVYALHETITRIGQNLDAPPDTEVIDGTGMFVTPGIIDCHSHIAVDGSVNEGSISVSSIANIAEVLDSDDISIYRDLAGGVTTANILHGSANSIGGQTIVIKLRWGQPASKLPFEGALPGFLTDPEKSLLLQLVVAVAFGNANQKVDAFVVRASVIFVLFINRRGKDDLFLYLAVADGRIAALEISHRLRVAADAERKGRVFAQFGIFLFVADDFAQVRVAAGHLTQPEDASLSHFVLL